MSNTIKLPVKGSTINIPSLTDEELAAAKLAEEETARIAAEEEAKRLELERQNNNPNNTPTAKQIEIDGSLFTLDEIGNAIDDKGVVIMTAADIANATSNIDTISEISKITGIVLNDETGKPIIYEDSVTGIANREVDVLNFGIKKGKETLLSELKTNNPDIFNMLEYKNKFGSLEGYGTSKDYSKITIDPLNESLLTELVVEWEVANGKTLEMAKTISEWAKADNKLEIMAKSAQSGLLNNQLKIEAEKAKSIEIKNIENKKLIENYYGVSIDEKGNIIPLNVENSIYDIVVNKKKANNLSIPDEGIIVKDDKGTVTKMKPLDVFSFMSIADEKTGLSKGDALINDYFTKNDNKVAFALFLLKGGDLNELAKSYANQSRVEDIIKIQRSTGNKLFSNNSSKGSGSGQIKFPVK